MARKIRFTPDGGALYEVTCRTVHSRFLLRPGPLLNEIIVGALGRAQRLYPLEICAFVFASNHFHLLARAVSTRSSPAKSPDRPAGGTRFFLAATKRSW